LRLRGPLAEDPTAPVLHVLVLALAVWYGLWSIILLPLYPNLGARLAVAILLEVSLVAALVLLRYGLLRQASLVYLAGTWVGATVRIALSDGIRSTSQVLYVTLPILATWLLGNRAALWTAGVCLGSSLVFACLDLAGLHRSLIIPITPLATWALLLQVILTGVVPVVHVLRTLRETLARSHRTGEELRRTVDRLQVEIVGRDRTELALRESEERFRVMADTAPVLIVAADANQRATFFNKAWLDFTGRTMAQELGTGWTTGVHSDDVEGCLNGISSAYAERRECRVQYRLRRADGEYRLLLCNGVPRFEPDGSFVGYVASCIDITDFKRSQEEAVARQKLESLGVLAGGIAHDFNNLLGGIMADSEVLIDELKENSSALESVRRIDAVAMRASEVVRQLMVYAGQESAEFEQVDLAALVREMLQLMRLSVSKNAAFEVDLPGKLRLINANPTQIRQVLMNLVTNASEALGGKEGVISVKLDEVHQGQESVSGQEAKLPPGDYLRLNVSDTGYGMTKEILAGLFDPFFTTKGAGRGLGLSAVLGIIRSHGGTIGVVSAPGQGSRFEIILPCVNQPERAPQEIRKPISSDGNEVFTGTVLLIEDEDPLRLATAKMLRRRGLFVLEAGEGRAAVDLFRARAAQIDAVLLDVTLPGMSGRKVLEELRKARPTVKVILTSAYGRDHALETVGGEKSQPYIRKPYRLDELAVMIRGVCLDELSNRVAR
jgi:two-component system, cell cycle sensor histidine kinase and response regulator CckA